MNAVVAILAAVLNSAWQAAAAAALVWLALRWAPRAGVAVNAATRYVIWWLALAVLVTLPIAPRIASGRGREVATAAAVAAVETAPSPPPDASPAVITLKRTQSSRWPWWILSLWSMVLLYRTARILQSYLYLRGVKARASAAL